MFKIFNYYDFREAEILLRWKIIALPQKFLKFIFFDFITFWKNPGSYSGEGC